MSYKCICGKMLEEGNSMFEVWVDGECYEFVCEECSKTFFNETKFGHTVEVFSSEDSNEECYLCSFCGEIHLKSNMVLEGSIGNEDWLCKDCLNSLYSRGEHLQIHHNF